MAPRKETKEKSDTAAADLILSYLRKQNRPYSATDISSNLHNKVSKAAAAKLLKDLHERREIEGRAAGKQIVYHSIQSAASTTPTDLAELTATINNLRTQTASHTANIRTLRTHLASLSSTLSTSDLTNTLASLSQERAELIARLEPLRAGQVKPVDAEEMKNVDNELKRWEGINARRTKIEKEIWDMMRENVPSNEIEALREKLGLDD